jgi:hypothetical protein
MHRFPKMWMSVPRKVIKLGDIVIGTNFNAFSARGDHKYLYEYATEPPLNLNFFNYSAP